MKLAENVKPLGLLFLAIPFMAMIFMIATNHYKENAYQEYRIAIDGYDPRDLLKGHYLIFRYKWPEPAFDMYRDTRYFSGSACVCFSGDNSNLTVRFDECIPMGPQKLICEGAIKVSKQQGEDRFQPVEELRRYYIPEEHSSRLENMLREGKHKFSVGIVPQPGGEAVLKMMYVDGIPLDEYLRSNLIVRPEPAR